MALRVINEPDDNAKRSITPGGPKLTPNERSRARVTGAGTFLDEPRRAGAGRKSGGGGGKKTGGGGGGGAGRGGILRAPNATGGAGGGGGNATAPAAPTRVGPVQIPGVTSRARVRRAPLSPQERTTLQGQNLTPGQATQARAILSDVKAARTLTGRSVGGRNEHVADAAAIAKAGGVRAAALNAPAGSYVRRLAQATAVVGERDRLRSGRLNSAERKEVSRLSNDVRSGVSLRGATRQVQAERRTNTPATQTRSLGSDSYLDRVKLEPGIANLRAKNARQQRLLLIRNGQRTGGTR